MTKHPVESPDGAREPATDEARYAARTDRRAGVPRHVAIIMDGNGRWAQQRGLPRVAGHAEGAHRVPPVTAACAKAGVEALTLYSFSIENWKRPPDEVEALMQLTRERLIAERTGLIENRVRFRRIGRRDGVPGPLLEELDRTEELTAHHKGITLCLAVNYGSRTEITDAVRAIARRVRAGELDPESIDEPLIGATLYTAGLPDPDLLIRTAGELRLSNYLLWQLSYAELHVTETLWPDFDEAALQAAFDEFARRTRKYGGLTDAPATAGR